MAKLIATKIHPSIGIARVGNHPTDFYIGPEKPNQFIQEAEIGGFKKLDGDILKIKRQAARFRVYGYYDNGEVKELDNSVADVVWKVKVANIKSKSIEFSGTTEAPKRMRNDFVKSEEDRKLLALTPDEVTISGTKQEVAFKNVKFKVREADGTLLESGDISLGKCMTDEQGRLLVLGGVGNAGSVKEWPLKSHDNNDYWYDDVADGYVKATVQIKATGETLNASDAWVLVAPPKYVPHMHSITSLYDTLTHRFIKEGKVKATPRPKFYADVYPILLRSLNIKWLYEMEGHHFESMLLPDTPLANRERFLKAVRQPGDNNSPRKMPKLFGDDYTIGTTDNKKMSRLAFNETQYQILEDWKNGNIDIDSKDALQPPAEITPEGLDRASLEHCVGAPFFPGIETSWSIRDKFAFSEPYRLDSSKIEPGDLTRQSALPWQADYFACSKENASDEGQPADYITWWPYARPDEVFAENATTYSKWTPEDQFMPLQQGFKGYMDMVEKWSYLGIVVEKDGRYVEVQRQFPNSAS